eukprot:15225711-Alexandrium_andersonii.AAC.1
MHKSPFCMPEAKAALADLWTHSVDCLDQMRALVQKRAAESASVPLSVSVPHYADAVGKGKLCVAANLGLSMHSVSPASSRG